MLTFFHKLDMGSAQRGSAALSISKVIIAAKFKIGIEVTEPSTNASFSVVHQIRQ